MPPEPRDGAQLVVEFLKKSGVKYLFGIPGHGNVSIFDAAREMAPDLTVVPVKHEQWGGHMADGYFRANRKVPAAVSTSVGPGATNLATALTTAYVDSSTFLALTGQIQTYLFGRGIFQEIERQHWIDYANAMQHLVKGSWTVTSAVQLPRVMTEAMRTALGGRPGPVLVDIPMDVQVERTDALVPNLSKFLARGRIRPDSEKVVGAAKLLLGAERPLLLVGGGVVMSDASKEAVAVAEFIGAPALCTFRGDSKGGFPEDHELYGFHPGNIGNAVSNEVAKRADVIIAVGVTFSDETTSSYVPGVTFRIPPTKLIHIDIDPHEIGKNYQTEIGIVADAKAAMVDLLAALKSGRKKGGPGTAPWVKRFRELKVRWEAEMERLRKESPMGIPNVVAMLRGKLPKSTIVTVSAGLPQEIMSQQWIAYSPRTFISSGGYSTMGFALPAGIGARLAQPKVPVVAVEGDGSFMMNSVELSTAVQLQVPLLVVILNNKGWVSIRDLQIRSFKGRLVGTEFMRKDGSAYEVDFEKLARAYGAEYSLAASPSELSSQVTDALSSSGVTVLEAEVERKFPKSGTSAFGYWDIPSRYK
ncbi:MAG TPA: thiamine pyrophosphate-binding protein [Nitrososphaerales archaeon]|nr:thiamine pyrophosphate-binding protein [Nitrososphaerales archaeon]